MNPDEELREAIRLAVADCKDAIVRGWLASLADAAVTVPLPQVPSLAA